MIIPNPNTMLRSKTGLLNTFQVADLRRQQRESVLVDLERLEHLEGADDAARHGGDPVLGEVEAAEGVGGLGEGGGELVELLLGEVEGASLLGGGDVVLEGAGGVAHVDDAFSTTETDPHILCELTVLFSLSTNFGQTELILQRKEEIDEDGVFAVFSFFRFINYHSLTSTSGYSDEGEHKVPRFR